MAVKEITVNEAVDIMVERGYEPEQLAPFTPWHENGRTIIIFQNQDLGHPQLGHVFAMPWDEPELPRQGPDTAQTGLGWRYTPEWVVRP